MNTWVDVVLIDIKDRNCCHEFANIFTRLGNNKITVIEAGDLIKQLREEFPLPKID